jgi:hypothetical protein
MYWVQHWTKKVYFCDYNELCLHPEEEIKAIADFFGQELKPRGLIYPPENWHNLFGNSAWKGTHFNKKIKVDTRWQKELTKEEKASCRAMHLNEMHETLKRLADRSRKGLLWTP